MSRFLFFLLCWPICSYADMGTATLHYQGQAMLSGKPLADAQILCRQGEYWKYFRTDAEGRFSFTMTYVTPCISGGGSKTTESLMRQVEPVNGSAQQFLISGTDYLIATAPYWKQHLKARLDKKDFRDTVELSLQFLEPGDVSDFEARETSWESMRKQLAESPDDDRDDAYFDAARLMLHLYEWRDYSLDEFWQLSGLPQAASWIFGNDNLLQINLPRYVNLPESQRSYEVVTLYLDGKGRILRMEWR